MAGYLKHHFQPAQKHCRVLDFAACMHMQALYIQLGGFYHALYMAHLVYGYAELAVYMAGRNFIITTSLYMRVDAYANRVGGAKLMPEPLQDGDIVNIDVYA